MPHDASMTALPATAADRAAQRAATPAAALPPMDRTSASPSRVFVSYAQEDSNFVRFLTAMLDVHRLPYWHDVEHVTPMRGKPRVMDHLQQGLQESDALLLVASPSTPRSSWVRAEVDAFLRGKVDPFVIPAVLAPCDLSRIHPALHEHVFLDFHSDMLDAFKRLMRSLGSEWLPLIDQRSTRGDRRSSATHQRLEYALCQTVRDRGLPLTQALPYDSQNRLLMELLEGFQAAVQKSYRLIDPSRGTEATVTAHTFRDTMLRAIEGRTLEHVVPAFLVKAVVRELGVRFRVEGRERRKGL